jgi:hypothetical protein
MCQPVAEVVGKPGRKDLGLGFETAKGARMDHAVAISLKTVSVWMFRFGVPPSPALLRREPQPREHER